MNVIFLFQECEYEDVKADIVRNNKDQPVPLEVFAEYHILNSRHFNIMFEDNYIGYCSILNGNTLIQFYLIEDYRNLSQDVFSFLKDIKSVKMAWIRTCDEFFLSLALGVDSDIKQQAYCFRHINRINVQSEINPTYRLASLDDLDIVRENSGDFFDEDLEKQINENGIYIGFDQDKPIAFGLFERGKILEDSVSLGMFTIPEYRGKNIGKKTLSYLLDESRKYYLTPTAGCWDSHKLSKRVLEGVGMVSDTKYLKISF